MKTAVTYAYTFTPGSANTGTLNLTSIPSFNIKKLYSVVNVTANSIIYAAGLPEYGLFNLVGSTLTLAKNTSTMNSTDQLLIIYDDDTQIIKTDSSAVTQPISGSVSVSNFPATQPVSGPLTDTQLRALSVPVSGPLTDTQLRATAVPVSGSVSVSNFPGTQPVSGSVDVTPTTPVATDYLPVRLTNGTAFYEAGGGGGGGNGAILDGVDSAIKATVTAANALKVDGSAVTQPMSAASLPLPAGASTESTLSSMSGKLPATLGAKTIANSLAVNIASDQTVPVSGTVGVNNFPATQAVTGPLTDTQLRATPVPVSGTVTANATLAAETTKVIGTVNIAAAQSVTSNAGTNTSTANLDVALSTRLKPADTLAGVTTVTNLSQLNGNAVSMNTGVRDAGTQRVTIATNDVVPVTGPLTNTELRATNVAANIRDSAGQVQYNFPAGFVRTSDEPRQTFYDPFDAALDTTNRWNTPTATGTATAASVTSGQLTMGTGTTANGVSNFSSLPTFVPTVPSWLGNSYAIKLESPITANTYRFWGLGTAPGTPTAAAPLTDACGFELATDGKLYAVVYAAGVRTVVQDLSSATGNSKQPTDTAYHRYIIYYRTDRTFFYIDSLDTPVATSNFQSPTIQTLPVRMLAIAGSVAPASSGVINCTGLAVWDTGKNATNISDGTYPHRKAKVSSTGAIAVDATLQSSLKLTYSGATAAFTPPATPTDLLRIIGSATKTIRILKIELTCTQTTAGINTFFLIKRSTANTVGTAVATTAVAHDSTNVAATAAMNHYTANPTLGSAVGNLKTSRVLCPAITSVAPALHVWDFQADSGQPIVLRGVAESVCLNFGGAALPAGLSVTCAITWTEE